MGKTYEVGPRQTFTPLPTGDYVLTLKNVSEHLEEEDSQYSKKGDMRLEWTWEVAIPDEEPATRRSRAAPPASWNEKSTFVKIAEALRLVDHERAVTEGAKINWDVAIGKQCIGSILKLPKEGKPGEWTDNIKAFAPLPNGPVVPQSSQASGKPSAGLIQRYNDLVALSGLPDTLEKDASPLLMAQAMKVLGNKPLTDMARSQLKDLIDMSEMAGGGHFDELGPEATMKDGLLQADAIQKSLSTF